MYFDFYQNFKILKKLKIKKLNKFDLRNLIKSKKV